MAAPPTPTSPGPPPTTGAPRSALLLVALVVGLASLAGAGVRATTGGRITADEPQYLLSALSLVEDGDLDVADELAEQRWRDWHRAELPRQTAPLPDGSELSPHDPLLPVLLAPGVWAGQRAEGVVVALGIADDWRHAELAGARVVLALVAAALAALVLHLATARLGVGPRAATIAVLGAGVTAPLVTYGHQLYPELPAALAVAVAAAGLLPRPPVDHRADGGATTAELACWVGAVVALPWLGVKYVGVAAAVAALGGWRELRHGSRRRTAVVAGLLAVAGGAYLVAHQRIWGGWTVYAAGDHFVGGELTVVGEDPDHLARSVRLLGLLVDRDFGLVAWAPGWLLAVPAVALVARRRDRVAAVLGLPLLAGWATATWVALTMHGWWWPGRQVVVVLPLVVLAVAVLLDRSPRLQPVALGAAALGVATWAWTAWRASTGGMRLIVDLDRVTAPVQHLWRPLLPDLRDDVPVTWVLYVGWLVVVVALARAGWRLGAGAAGPSRSALGGDEDPLGGEGADADGAPVDLHGRGAVR